MNLDEQFAKELTSLCDECCERPPNRGYIYCGVCYDRRKTRTTRRCETCHASLYSAEICSRCDTPVENASYETLLEWGERRKPAKKIDESILNYCLTANATEESECSICLETIEIGSQTTRLPCIHMFHAECISKWIVENPQCPVCQHNIKS